MGAGGGDMITQSLQAGSTVGAGLFSAMGIPVIVLQKKGTRLLDFNSLFRIIMWLIFLSLEIPAMFTSGTAQIVLTSCAALVLLSNVALHRAGLSIGFCESAKESPICRLDDSWRTEAVHSFIATPVTSRNRHRRRKPVERLRRLE